MRRDMFWSQSKGGFAFHCLCLPARCCWNQAVGGDHFSWESEILCWDPVTKKRKEQFSVFGITSAHRCAHCESQNVCTNWIVNKVHGRFPKVRVDSSRGGSLYKLLESSFET